MNEEPVTTAGGRDPDGCTGVIVAILLEVVVCILIFGFLWLIR